MQSRNLYLAGIIALLVLYGCATTYSGGSSGGHRHIIQKGTTSDVARK